jgi:signal transduction histidine kinase
MSFRQKIIMSIVIVVLVITSLCYVFIIRSHNLPYPWLKKGATSVYVGSVTYGVGATGRLSKKYFTLTVTITLAIRSVNKTHYLLYLLITYEVEQTGYISTKRNASWIPINDPRFLIFKDYRLNNTSRTKMLIDGLGLRNVIVRRYVSTINSSSIITVYIDEEEMWPLEFVLAGQGYSKPLHVVITAHNFKL